MASDNPGRPNFPGRPAASPFGAASPQAANPFFPSPSVVRPDASGPRPPSNPAYPSSVPFPALGSESFRPAAQGRFNSPYAPIGPPPTQVSPTSNYLQRFPTPQFPTTVQTTTVSGRPTGPPSFGPPPQTNEPTPIQPSYVASAAVPNFRPPPQAPSIPMLTTTQGYRTTPQVSPSPYFGRPISYAPPPPPMGVAGQHSRDSLQHPMSGPPIGNLQGLVEDFSSLSLGTVPGSLDPGLDFKALPRPLEGDVEPTSLSGIFPFNCHPRYLRLTTSGMPNSQSLVSRWHLPLGAVVCPLAESPEGEEVPIVNFASTGIIRCRRCRTYVNPYVTFSEGGRKWRCNICALLNDVSGDYFAHLDVNNRRVDMDQRPELTQGSVEFVAPTEYMVRPPMPPLYFFLIDVSVSAVRSGMLEVVAETIKSCLDNLPGFPRTQIGFITFDSTIHFYNMKSSLTQPQMMVVSDVEDIFVPLPDDLLVNLSESKTVVETFLDSLPGMFQDNTNLESAFGPALKAAFMVMNQLGGKLLIFQNTLPSLGVGRLRLRGDDPRIYGTDKEYLVRIADDAFYKQTAADLTKYQIAVNVYAFSDKYTDIASLGTLAKYTGGQVYYYPNFQIAVHKEKLKHELGRDLTRETAWEAVMRVRCGKGVRFTSYHGNFMLRSTDLIALPAVDCDKAFAMQLCLEETLLTTPNVYFQVALLYTSSSGERRIRVHTAAVPVVNDLGEMYRQADTGAVVSLLCRLAIEKSLSSKLEDARSAILLRVVKALREYRNLYAVQHRLAGRLIYPDSLKYLPLYVLALCKSTPLRGGFSDAELDDRCAVGSTMMTLPVKKLLKLLYPSLLRVDEYLSKLPPRLTDLKEIGGRLPLTIDSLDSRGLYVYDDGFRFVIWIGKMVSPDISRSFNVEFTADPSKANLPLGDNEITKRLMSLLNKLRESDPSYYQLCHFVWQGQQPREGFYLLTNLLEDQMGATSSYADWIVQIHRQVQQNAGSADRSNATFFAFSAKTSHPTGDFSI
ncbi:transport protein SEC24 A-like protein [Drosera capensis]